MRSTGVEPARSSHKILSLARLPIPPRPHINQRQRCYCTAFRKKSQQISIEKIIDFPKFQDFFYELLGLRIGDAQKRFSVGRVFAVFQPGGDDALSRIVSGERRRLDREFLREIAQVQAPQRCIVLALEETSLFIDDVFPRADEFRRGGHELHETHRARAALGVLVEPALREHDGIDEGGGNPGALDELPVRSAEVRAHGKKNGDRTDRREKKTQKKPFRA